MVHGSLRLVLILLAGLSAGTSASAEPAQPAPKRAGGATIVVTRADERLNWALDANIEVNGQPFVKLAKGATYRGGVRPGPTVITVNHWSTPGKYSVKFTAQPGRSYRFVVSSREEQMWAGALFGLSGIFLDAVVNENSGTFKLEPGK